jgi:hypothetical protein
MNRLAVIRALARGYLATAVVFSFMHLIHAAQKAGGTTAEAIATPFLIDGLFLGAMILRSEQHSTRTRKIGAAVQITAGALSVVGNAYAASTLFSACFGAMLPILVIGFEWLLDPRQLKSADAEQADQDAAQRAANKAAGIEKANATRARNKADADKAVKAADKLTRAAARHRTPEAAPVA